VSRLAQLLLRGEIVTDPGATGSLASALNEPARTSTGTFLIAAKLLVGLLIMVGRLGQRSMFGRGVQTKEARTALSEKL